MIAIPGTSKFLVFGGFKRYNESFKSWESYGDVLIFDVDTLVWDQVNTHGLFHQWRGHVSTFIGKHVLVHGGFNHKGEKTD